jgi:hypothetical protein
LRENRDQLLAYLPYFQEEKQKRGSVAKESHLMHTTYEKTMESFVDDVCKVGFIDTDHHQALEARGIKGIEAIEKAIPEADEHLLKAIVTQLIRAERFMSGAWIGYVENGTFLSVLRRLKELEANKGGSR